MPLDISAQFEEHARVLQQTTALEPLVEQAARRIIHSYHNGGKLLAMGNGGSASDALHICGEMLGRFRRERHSFPAMALNADVATMTAIGNDYGFDQIFRRQLEGLCQPNDVILALSTSGNSPNIIQAAMLARDRGACVLALTGRDGGALAQLADIELRIPSDATPRIQEMHILLIHLICDIVEAELTQGCNDEGTAEKAKDAFQDATD